VIAEATRRQFGRVRGRVGRLDRVTTTTNAVAPTMARNSATRKTIVPVPGSVGTLER
jgi:hypothetical protein